MTPTIRLALRLSPDEQAALATVAGKIASPLRRTPTASDALRAAVLFAAGAMPAAVAIGHSSDPEVSPWRPSGPGSLWAA